MHRTLTSAATVAAAAFLSFAAARGVRKPYSTDAPSFRQLGPADAKVRIIEFSDFQCPACRYAEKPLRGLLSYFDGKVHLTFKHYPLERMHRNARRGAVAAECAGRLGRFWDYHHLLYDRQDEWSAPTADTDAKLEAYARELKLDPAAFDACRKDPSADAAVSADQKDGDNAWVMGTPTFFVNGKRFSNGADLAERGVPFIEKELKR